MPTTAPPTLPLVLTAGEPAGIGPDLCIALAHTPLARELIVIADPELLKARARKLGTTISLTILDGASGTPASSADAGLRVLPQHLPNPLACGTPDPANAQTLLDGLSTAVHGCREGRFSGMVTAPLQKSVINDAGIPFTGHTEFLAQLTDTELPVMLLVGGGLRVALASTHLPLSAVPAYVTHERLVNVLTVLHSELKTKFGCDDPEISVLGMNPHAGEGGHLGHEDAEVIAPAIDELKQRGWKIRGPLPADTAFTPAGGSADAVLAMYHDQGLPVLKYASFGTAVNVTLGLPIVRTSVDHGTALDIAGRGGAESGSLIAAVELALTMTGA